MRLTDAQKRALMTPVEQKANDRQAKAAAAYARIDSDPARSEHGKRQAKIQEWSALRHDLTALQAEEARSAETRRQSLQRSLFGLPGTASANDVMAHRDATERASRIDNEAEAVRAMHMARDVGDTQIVRAIAARAVQAGWSRLVDAYVADIHPDAAPTIAELTQPALTPTRDFNHSAYFLAFSPPGLETVSDWQLQSEAQQIDSSSPAPVGPEQAAAVSMLGDLFRELDSRPQGGTLADGSPLDVA